MSPFFPRPLQNRYSWPLGELFAQLKRLIFLMPKCAETTDPFRFIGDGTFGSDGWNRTTDLGVMNSYKAPSP